MIIDETFMILEDELETTSLVKEIIISSGFTGVILENNDMGVAMNIRKGAGFNDPKLLAAFKDLIGMDCFRAGKELSLDTDFLSASIRVAIMNAISRPLMDEESLRQRGFKVEIGYDNHSTNIITKNDTVAIVGFGGNVWPMTKKAKKVYVSELEPDAFRSITLNREGVVHGPDTFEIVDARDAADCFREADTILLTGCSLVSGTMESILKQCRDKRVILYGSTASFFPKRLFDLGVDAVATRIVMDAALTAALLKNCSHTVERYFPQSTVNLNISI